MEAKQLFKPKMQVVSFHKIYDVDDFQFDNECPDNDNPNIAFTVWADGLFNPRDFDGVELVKISELKKRVKWLRDEIYCLIGQVRAQTDDNEGFGFPYKEIKEKLNEAFSDLNSANAEEHNRNLNQ